MPYKDFYHMQAEAFGSLPILNLFYSSRTHQDGWRYLVAGITDREPFLLVTGDYGMGKTLLCMMLLRLLEKKQASSFVYISNPHCGFAGILRQTAACFKIDTREHDESGILNSLYNHPHNFDPPRQVSIIIDDAQELGTETLVKLRALANFNRSGFFPFQLIFFAHPSFIELLKDPRLIALGQRIRRRHRLMPLTLQETKEYIYFRLFKSGAPGTPSFTEDALQEIYASAVGVPRLINNICDASLTQGASKMERVISRGTVKEARAASGELFAAGMQAATAAGGQPRSDSAACAFQALPVCMAPLEQPVPTPVPIGESTVTVAKQPSRALFIKTAVLAAACIIAFLLIQQYDETTAPDTTRQDQVPTVTTAPLRNAAGTPGIMDNATGAAQPTAAESLPAGAVPADVRPAMATPRHDPAVQGAPAITGTATAGKRPGASRPVPESDVLAASNNASSELIAGLLEEKPAAIAPGGTHNGTAAAPAREPPRPYTLKLSCFNTPERVKNAAAYYAQKGLSPFVVKINLQQQGFWWIFYLGSFAAREEAFAARTSCNLPDAQVIPMPYANRIGAFASREKAADAAARFEKLGCCPYTLNNDDGTVSLFTGAFMQRGNAEAQQKTLTGSTIPSTVAILKTAVTLPHADIRSAGSMREPKP